MTKPPMNIFQWLVSTVIAGISMSLGIIGYIHAAVYTRPEGEELHRRIEVIEVQERQDLSAMRDKVDRIMELLIEQKNTRKD